MDDDWPQGHRHRRLGHWVTGLALIGIGSLFLLERWSMLEGLALAHHWPFILAVVGVLRMVDARNPTQVAKGGFLVFLAFWIYAALEHLWGLSFYNSWPLILIALGLRYILVGLVTQRTAATEESQT